VLTTDQKGAVAETAIIHAAVKLGIGVFKPISDGERYDLIFDIGTRLLRVQCKWARRYGDVIAVRTYSSRRARNGIRKRSYTGDDVDVIAVYCHDVHQCYLLCCSSITSTAARSSICAWRQVATTSDFA